ncbi:MAG: hypothetical protein LW768_10995 [Rubrivivax sp.]|jgi:hypothetical protein|nr:hypothetical protein [Rubrivivax sp.]
MPMFHAVIWLDHETARIFGFDAENVDARKVRAHHHPTGQHGSEVRTQHEYFAAVCEALEGPTEVLALGPRTGLADFEHYAKKHRPQTARRIVGWEHADHPTDNQIVAQARDWFVRYDRMNGVPTPT